MDSPNDDEFDEFFDRFHETFVVLETVAKANSALNKNKKPLQIELKNMKQHNPYFVKKTITK